MLTACGIALNFLHKMRDFCIGYLNAKRPFFTICPHIYLFQVHNVLDPCMPFWHLCAFLSAFFILAHHASLHYFLLIKCRDPPI